MSDIEGAEILANKVEQLFEGESTASVLYAMGMLIAHAIATADRPDPDATLALMDKIVRGELDRQFAPHLR